MRMMITDISEFVELDNADFVQALERMYLLQQITKIMKSHPVFQKYPDLENRLTEMEDQILDIVHNIGQKEHEWLEFNRHAENDE